jgi:hypothetical protein
MKLFALITCDSVSIEEKTGKHSIFGHFSSIKVKSFPATHPALTFFVGITDLEEGEHSIEVVLTPPPPPESEDEEALAAEEQLLVQETLESSGPLDRLYLISELRELTFDYPGEWQLGVFIDGDFAGEIGLNIIG